MNIKRWLLLALIALAIVAYFALDLGRFLTLETLKAGQDEFAAAYAADPLTVIAGFFLVYVGVTALSLPGAAVLTLASGALFGLVTGTLLASFASSIGATLAFLAARYLLQDTIRRRFGKRLEAIDRGIERDGAFYLFAMRLVPLFPFFVINLLMGLTSIRAATFYWVSQVGMLAGTLVYVNAGTRLAAVESPGDIFSPALLASFALLGVFPLLARKLLARLRARRALAGWPRPRHFDYNLMVIGAGSAGLVAAHAAATARARVALVEAGAMGGDCLNTGCVPSKALLRSARFLGQARRAEALGMDRVLPDYEFGRVMQRVRRVIDRVAPHDSAERYRGLGVDVIRGRARLVSPWEVEVDGCLYASRAIVLATGAEPRVPDLPGLEQVRHYTSETIWDLAERPGELLVLGGGPIGCELAQAFARLDCRVTLATRGGLMGKEDPDAAAAVEDALAADGVRILKQAEALRCEIDDGVQRLVIQHDGAEHALPFDALLLALGRVPCTRDLGLEALGISLGRGGTVETNAWLQTRCPNIYACGDLAGPHQFTHTAGDQGWHAAMNALLGGLWRISATPPVVPWVTFTDPEVARAGLSEEEARAQGIPHEVTRYGLQELDRAIVEEATDGFVKVLTAPGKDRVLGVCIVGSHAGELLAEFVLAMRHDLGLRGILGTLHPYPTWTEANKAAAGAWQRAHLPARWLAWAARYHDWRRG